MYTLFVTAFGSLQLYDNNRSARKKLMQQRHHARVILIQIFSAVMFLLLMAASAFSQTSATYNQPSGEMGLSLPPMPDMPNTSLPMPPMPAAASTTSTAQPRELYNFSNPAPKNNTSQGSLLIDQFFSTTTIVTPDVETKKQNPVSTSFPEPVVEAVAPKKRNKIYYRRFNKPEHQFKSVKLPENIYRHHYSKYNQHLPIALYEHDRQQLLLQAVHNDDVSSIRSLHHSGASLDWHDEEGTPLLISAVRHHSVNAVRWLLRQAEVKANIVDAAGYAPLHYAAFSGNHEIVQLLLQHGADINQADAKGHTAAEYASIGAYPTIVTHQLK